MSDYVDKKETKEGNEEKDGVRDKGLNYDGLLKEEVYFDIIRKILTRNTFICAKGEGLCFGDESLKKRAV